jgi:hypothetical protein
MSMNVKHTPSEEPVLSVYQTMLLEALKSKPELLHLLKVIFSDYPKLIIAEYSMAKGATKKKRDKSLKCAELRMKMESYIEEKISRAAGIDIDTMVKKQKEADAIDNPFETATDKMCEEIDQEEQQRILESINTVVSAGNKGE